MLRLWSAVARPPAEPGKGEAWETTYPTRAGNGLDVLEVVHLPPEGVIHARPSGQTELVTYVREGTVAYENASGRPYLLRAGEFSRMAGGVGASWTVTNPSRSDWAHLFRIYLFSPSANTDPGSAQKRFSTAERRGRLCLVASDDGRDGSLAISRGARIFSAIVVTGQHVVHELPRDSCVSLHVVDGEVALDDIVLNKGDGVGLEDERALSFTAREDSEVLLLQVDAPGLPTSSAEARGL